MKFVKLTGAQRGGAYWINPAMVVRVSPGAEGPARVRCVGDDEGVEVKESPEEVVKLLERAAGGMT